MMLRPLRQTKETAPYLTHTDVDSPEFSKIFQSTVALIKVFSHSVTAEHCCGDGPIETHVPCMIKTLFIAPVTAYMNRSRCINIKLLHTYIDRDIELSFSYIMYIIRIITNSYFKQENTIILTRHLHGMSSLSMPCRAYSDGPTLGNADEIDKRITKTKSTLQCPSAIGRKAGLGSQCKIAKVIVQYSYTFAQSPQWQNMGKCFSGV